VADEPPTGTCPAYADPADNDPLLQKQAAATIDDLVGGPPTDPDAPWGQLQGWLNDLESDDYQTRVAGKQNLESAFADHPAVEPTLDDALQAARDAGDKPQTVMDLDSILGPVRFRIDNNSNTIVATSRTPFAANVARVIISLPASGSNVTFSVTGNPNATNFDLGGNPSSITITPAVETENLKVMIHISYMDANGELTGDFDCPFALDLRTWIDIGGD